MPVVKRVLVPFGEDSVLRVVIAGNFQVGLVEVGQAIYSDPQTLPDEAVSLLGEVEVELLPGCISGDIPQANLEAVGVVGSRCGLVADKPHKWVNFDSLLHLSAGQLPPAPVVDRHGGLGQGDSPLPGYIGDSGHGLQCPYCGELLRGINHAPQSDFEVRIDVGSSCPGDHGQAFIELGAGGPQLLLGRWRLPGGDNGVAEGHQVVQKQPLLRSHVGWIKGVEV
ncbi:hypothetical protein ES703_112764 [subsurface metagenome]